MHFAAAFTSTFYFSMSRPLSPHLQIYKVQVTSFFSVMHRLTGILLFILLMLSAWCFILYAYFPESSFVNCLGMLLSSTVAKMLYFLCFVSFAYHSLNGVRHLLWDLGTNLEITAVTISAAVVTLILIFVSVLFLYILI